MQSASLDLKNFQRTWIGGVSVVLLFSHSCFEQEPELVSGKAFHVERIGAIKAGDFTKSDVEELLGEPESKESLPEQQEKWNYTMCKEQNRKFLGLFLVDSDITETQVEIIFQNDLVKSVDKEVDSYTE